MLEDKLLIWKFNRGDRAVLHAIYDKYKHDLVTLAAALLTDVALAEDVVHDTFVSFIESAQRFRLTGSLKGYLATCVANRARNVNKSNRARRSAAPQNAGATAGDRDNPESQAIIDEQSQRLMQALAKLPYEQREVLMLRSRAGLTFRAIAQQQNVSINTVQGRCRYAIDKLRCLLDGEVTQ